MACVSSLCLHWGMVCSMFALVFSGDSSWDCRDRDDMLRDVPADGSAPSECTLDCTARTYREVQGLHYRLTVRFTDPRVGEADDYCWSTRIPCSPGQRLQNAFIILPVDLSVPDRDSLRLQIISETSSATLHQHSEYSLFPPECGLRYDVTEHVAAKELQPNLCVKIISQEQSTLGSSLTCPPFLVTTWERWNQG